MLLDLLAADDQRDDWYGWATNQMGHGVVGMALALLGDPVLAPLPLLAAIAAGYWLIWERGAQDGVDRRDSLVDTGHVVSGAALILAALHGGHGPSCGVAVLWAGLLALGIRARLPS